MLLDKSLTFRYDIANPNKHATGIWNCKNDTLILTYLPEQNVRKFKIEKLSRKNLTIKEKEITFNYTKR